MSACDQVPLELLIKGIENWQKLETPNRQTVRSNRARVAAFTKQIRAPRRKSGRSRGLLCQKHAFACYGAVDVCH